MEKSAFATTKQPAEEVKVKPSTKPTSIDISSALAMLREPQTASKISTILTQNGISIASPTLRLDIEGGADNTMLELDSKDITDLFAKFGAVEKVVVPDNQKSTAFITMGDCVAAYLAQQILNTQHLTQYQAKIFVKWNSEEVLSPSANLADTSSLYTMQRN